MALLCHLSFSGSLLPYHLYSSKCTIHVSVNVIILVYHNRFVIIRNNLILYLFSAIFNCFVDEIPEDCEDDPDVDCIRGNKAYKAQIAVFSYVLLGNVAVIVFICLLVYAVYKQEKKSDQYLSKGHTVNEENVLVSTVSVLRILCKSILDAKQDHLSGVDKRSILERLGTILRSELQSSLF